MTRMFYRQFIALAASAFAVTVAGSVSAQAPVTDQPVPAKLTAARPELRAFWVDGFNDGYKTPQQCEAMVANLRRMHCNAVFVQMRKRADAYYASSYEPWALDDPQHFDALAYVCKLAHAPGLPRIEVHAWINACAVGGNKSPESLTKRHPEWFSTSDGGADYDDESTKIDPGNPQAADWTFRVYMDVARHYPVDGIHLDFIRYGGTGKSVGHWGYNPVAVSRFNARYGLSGMPVWNDPKWQAWRREQVTALVRRVSVTAASIRPDLKVSAATICWGAPPADDAEYEAKSASYTQVFAPWRDWMREGLLDMNCTMTYFDQVKRPQYWTGWSAFVKTHTYGRLAPMGVGIWMNAIPDSIHQISDTRIPALDSSWKSSPSGSGAVLFSYASTDTINHVERQYSEDFYQALMAPGIWDTDVPLPAMPWKAHPTTGDIMGTALNPDLTPMDGSVVTVRSLAGGPEEYTANVDGNGYYAVVGLLPGKYSVTLRSAAGADTTIRTTIVAGKVSQIPVNVAGRKIAGVGDLPEGSGVTFSNAIVTAGSGRHGEWFFVADGFGKYPVAVRLPKDCPPAVPGDIVAVTGTVSHDHGLHIEASAVRLLAIERISPPSSIAEAKG